MWWSPPFNGAIHPKPASHSICPFSLNVCRSEMLVRNHRTICSTAMLYDQRRILDVGKSRLLQPQCLAYAPLLMPPCCRHIFGKFNSDYLRRIPSPTRVSGSALSHIPRFQQTFSALFCLLPYRNTLPLVALFTQPRLVCFAAPPFHLRDRPI